MLTREDLYMRSEKGLIPRGVWNALVDAVFSNRISSVVGGKFSAGPGGGTALEFLGGSGGGGSGKYPFQPYDITITEGVVIISLRAGQLNEILPRMGSGYLGDETAPSLSVVTGDLYLEIPTDEDGEPLEPTEDEPGIEVLNGDMPEDDLDDGVYYHRLGIVTVATVEGVTSFKYQALVQTSLAFGLCGGVKRIVRA